MTTYMGPVGALMSVKCPSGLSRGGGRSVSFSDTMARRKAFIGRNSPREWSVNIGVASPGDMAAFEWLASYGTPPFVYYPDDAVLHNILSPAAAALAPGTHDGLEGPIVEVEPGVYVKSASPDSDSWTSMPFRNGFLDGVPVAVGIPVTVSAWLRGSTSRINVIWRDVDGNTVGRSDDNPVSRNTMTRVSVTVAPPPSAAQMTLVLHGSQFAGPAVSLTDELTPYGPGRGAKRAVVHGLSGSLILVTRQRTLESASFTVSEVG